MLDCVGRPPVCIKIILGYLIILQYNATLLGTKNKCKSIEDVQSFNLRQYLFFKSTY